MSRPRGPDRDRILDAAEALFAEKGYDAVSLRTISAAASSNQSLLHYYFCDKDDLYSAIWERYIDIDRPMLNNDDINNESEEDFTKIIRDAVYNFFKGPKILSQSKQGFLFLRILIREFSDPNASKRGLLDRFIGPDRDAFMRKLAKPPMNMEQIEASVIYKVLGALVPVMMTPDQLSETHSDYLTFDRLVKFAVGGIVALHGEREQI